MRQVYLLSERLGLDMPITTAVYRLLEGQVTPENMVLDLMQRSPKTEN